MFNVVRWIIFIPGSFILAMLGAIITKFALNIFAYIFSLFDILQMFNRYEIGPNEFSFLSGLVFFYILFVAAYNIIPSKKIMVSSYYCTIVALSILLMWIATFIRFGFQEGLPPIVYIDEMIPAIIAIVISIKQILKKELVNF